MFFILVTFLSHKDATLMRLFGVWCTCIGLANASKLYIEG
nr:MAG TPA: hypothetical protein [Caudoviricetes sp.]